MDISAGKYVIGVSGGVDSVVLLNMLSKRKNLDIIVAHFNHGIRSQSANDEKFVTKLAGRYNCIVEIGRGRLGPNVSEETARKARYEFLAGVKSKHKAKAIITAHHQDDVIETAIINLLRGTSRRGLSSLKSSANIIRPLLSYSKQDIYKYAAKNKLDWVEDKSNMDQTYLRNWIRASIMPTLSPGSKARNQFLEIINTSLSQNEQINEHIAILSQNITSSKNNRDKFILLPDIVASEVVAELLKVHVVKNISRRTVAKLVNLIKTAKPNTKHDIDKSHLLIIDKNNFTILSR